MFRPNGVIQLFPLMRIALMLVLGIIAGDAFSSFIPSAAWLVLFILSLILFMLTRNRPLTASTAILMATGMMGGWLVTCQRADLNDCPVDEPLRYTAIVTDEPNLHGKVLQCRLLVLETNADQRCEPFAIRASILRDTLTGRWRTLAQGSTIVGQSVLNRRFHRSPSMRFRLDRWMAAHRLKATTFLHAQAWQSIQLTPNQEARIPVWERLHLYLSNYRKRLIAQTWNKKMSNENRALLEAMVLGEKSKLSHAQREAYSIAGVSHILALSGLHLGIIYTVLSLTLSFLFRRVDSNSWTALGVQSLLTASIWGYVFLVGMPPGAVRSAVMLTIYSAVSLLQRDKMSVNALSLAALIMLIGNPMLLWDISFQLSFVAVLAIFVFHPPLQAFARRNEWTGIVTALWNFIGVSLAAQMGTAPLVMHYFGRFSTYFLFANLLFIPLATALLYTSLLVILLQSLSIAQLGDVLLSLSDLLTTAMNHSATYLSSLPYASLECPSFNAAQTFLVYLLMGSLYILIYRSHRMLRSIRNLRKLSNT